MIPQKNLRGKANREHETSHYMKRGVCVMSGGKYMQLADDGVRMTAMLGMKVMGNHGGT
jgi:hypothetical protein